MSATTPEPTNQEDKPPSPERIEVVANLAADQQAAKAMENLLNQPETLAQMEADIKEAMVNLFLYGTTQK